MEKSNKKSRDQRRCWVPNCRNGRCQNQGQYAVKVKLFNFPRNVDRCLRWLGAIGDTRLAANYSTVTRCKYVCKEHFLPNHITPQGRSTFNAVPQIFGDARPPLPKECVEQFLTTVPPERQLEVEEYKKQQASIGMDAVGITTAESDASTLKVLSGGEEDDTFGQPDGTNQNVSESTLQSIPGPHDEYVENDVLSTVNELTTPVHFDDSFNERRTAVSQILPSSNNDLAVPLGTQVEVSSSSFQIFSRGVKRLAEEHLETPVCKRTLLASDTSRPLYKRPAKPSCSSLRTTNRAVLDRSGHAGVTITPVKKSLLSEVRKLKQKIKRLQESKNHLDALLKTKNLDGMLKSVVTTELHSLVQGNCRNSSRTGKARRWSQHEKVLALSIFKKSPKAYRLLSCFLTLPSVRTLLRVLEDVPMEPGLFQNVLEMMEHVARKWPDQDRYCTLMFDEMSLKKRLIYNDKKGLIEGYVDHGSEGRSNNVADHALVLMVQGLRRPYKQPIGCYFSYHSTPTVVLVKIVKKAIEALQKIGFIVKATVCDLGSTNRSAMNSLISATHLAKESQTSHVHASKGTEAAPTGEKNVSGSKPQEIPSLSFAGENTGVADGPSCSQMGGKVSRFPPFFRVGEHKIFVLYDVPHLFKCLRNNFMRSSYIKWDGKVARWSDITRLWRLDRHIFHARYLTKNHVFPTGKAKMKVKFAAQVLSHRMAGYLRTLSYLGIRKGDGLAVNGVRETANVISDFDRLFDYSNGSRHRDDYRKQDTVVHSQTARPEYKSRMFVSEGSGHCAVWRIMKEKLRRLKFWTWDGRQASQTGGNGWKTLRSPPFQRAYIETLDALQMLWDDVKGSIKFLNLRRLNQDPVENLFAVIRQNGVTNTDPTCSHFMTALKAAIVNRLVSNPIRNSNCEDDNSRILCDLREFLGKTHGKNESNTRLKSWDAADDPVDPISLTSVDDDLFPSVLHIPDDAAEVSPLTEEDLTRPENIGTWHVAGYIGKCMLGVLKGQRCCECEDSIRDSQPGLQHMYTQSQEYDPHNPALIYASFALSNAIYTAREEFEKTFVKQGRLFSGSLKQEVVCFLLSTLDFRWLTCSLHRDELTTVMTSVLSRMLVLAACKAVNNELDSI